MTREYRDERRWANTDPSLHYNHSEPAKPNWRQEYIRLLEIRDYDAAEALKSKHMISDECSDGDHDLCNFTWCNCDHHSSVQFRKEHPGLRSLSEIESEQEERSAA